MSKITKYNMISKNPEHIKNIVDVWETKKGKFMQVSHYKINFDNKDECIALGEIHKIDSKVKDFSNVGKIFLHFIDWSFAPTYNLKLIN